jgi:hypothetical protein
MTKIKSLIILISFIVFWFLFAITKERSEQKNAYVAAKNRENDSISTSLRKIRYCMTYDLRTIKWRRSLIRASIVTLMLFTILWNRMPTSTELITHILIITAVFTAIWSNFSTRTSSEAAEYVDNNIKHIKNLLTKNHSFILPNW